MLFFQFPQVGVQVLLYSATKLELYNAITQRENNAKRKTNVHDRQLLLCINTFVWISWKKYLFRRRRKKERKEKEKKKEEVKNKDINAGLQ